MSFNPCNCSLKIWKLIVTPIPKVEARLGVCGGSFLHTSYTPENMKCDSWASVLARTFASPCFGRESKFRVTIEKNNITSTNI